MASLYKTIHIASGNADGWSSDAPSFDNNDDYLAFGLLSGDNMDAFMLFTNIWIPQGAHIQAASIGWYCHVDRTVNPDLDVRIYCNDVDDATVPANQAAHIGKTRTTAFTAWELGNTTGGVEYATPSFVSAVQEVIDRSGWRSGNDLMVLIDNVGAVADKDTYMVSYDNDPTKCPQLIIFYTTQPTNVAYIVPHP